MSVQPGLKSHQGLDHAEREILVKFKPGVSADQIREINARRGTQVLSIIKKIKVYRLRTPKGSRAENILASYQADPNVEYAEPNFVVYAHFVPNDPYYRYQWNFDDSVSGANPYGGINGGGINLEPAWDTTKGLSSVVVAVVDTGVAYENFGPRFAQAPDLANTHFVPGYDFIENDTHPNDDNGHGTHVTGTIAQSTNNSLGVAGIAHDTSVMPVKVLDQSGNGTVQTVSDGVVFAADNGAKVINLSLGSSAASITLENALAYAYGKGVAIIASSGNDNGPVSYPAAYDAYAIAVGATRYDETRSPYSNFGSQLDLTAPGGDTTVDQNLDGYGDGILQQTFQGNLKIFRYYFFQGTSMASPHVSGVAALLIANGVSGPDRAREAMEQSAEDKGAAGHDNYYGSGLLDARAALNYQFGPVHDVAVTEVTVASTLLKGDVAQVTVAVANLGNIDETVTVHLTDQTDGVEIGTQVVNVAASTATNAIFSWDTQNSSLGNHTLNANADQVAGETNTGNNSSTASVTVQEPKHDVAVIAFNTPLSANQGDVISLQVTVENQGTYNETTSVSVNDLTDGVPLGSQPISLVIGEQKLISFDWNTATASISSHNLEANAAQVSGETDTADNTQTGTTEVKQPTALIKLHVANITMGLTKKGPNYESQATVRIEDALNQLISGATVSGDFSFNGVFLNSASGDTLSGGTILLRSSKIRASSGNIFTFTVQNVSKSGYAYDSASNAETSDSITV